ncbi:MAG: SpoIIE family protein phosphatase [Clostridia bacterium]|nr:SpoIIE family protein phosphatase [Clostridia bacterium]
MLKRKNADIFTLLLYVPVFFIFLCLNHVGNNAEPFGLALLFGLCYAGLSPIICGLEYFLSSLFLASVPLSLLFLLQAALLAFGFFLRGYLQPAHAAGSRLRRGTILPPFLCLVAGLSTFVFVAPFVPYPIGDVFPVLADAFTQKIIFAFLLFLLSAVFAIAVKALLHKFLKCRLQIEEILFSALLYLLTGIGFCRFFGFNAYLGTSFFLLLLFSYVTKDATGAVFAFVLGIPCALLGGVGIERFFILSVSLVLFCHTGKWGLCFALLCTGAAFAFLDGVLYPFTVASVPPLLTTLCPCILFLLLPNGILRKLENELIFYREKHLSRVTVNLGRAAVGGQLFELSSLFKEIQTTFSALDDDSAEKNACAFIVNTVWQEQCRGCPSFKSCQARALKSDLQKLVEIGCLKGRVSLIDMTENMAHTCDRQSDLLYAVNRQLTDFRRFMTEAENVSSGRALLASQAQGVSEILKSVALEQSRPLPIQTKAEKELCVAFLKAGIVCTEIMLFGEEEDFTLSLITYGKTDVKKLTDVAKYVLQSPLILSKRIPLNREKSCFIFRRRPLFDAAFGVATKTKEGERACGDTYAVVKIDERRFMVALADGMGSGEYAQKISACTLSLLESFYRAKMPPALILSTVNKLLSFGKEETFTCVDIGIVNLDTGQADLVKIGSPAAFILSEKSLQILESNSLPLGILDSLRPDCATYTLQENELLLFVSDGISGAFGSTADFCELLKKVPTANPQGLADLILDTALAKYGGVPKDDMTVVAVRLFKPAEKVEKTSA